MNPNQNQNPDAQRPQCHHGPHPDYSDEISLVELVSTFVRRRWTFYAVFLVTALAGLGYALLAEEQYEYVSLIQIAHKDTNAFFESPETTIATLNSRWLPEVETVYRRDNDKKLPFDVAFSHPEDTDLIRITTSASPDKAQTVEGAHSELIRRVKEHQDRLIEKERESIGRQIQSLEKTVDALKGENTGEAVARAIERRSRLESKLENLQAANTLVTSRQSTDSVAPKRRLIVVLALLLGGMLGVFLIFISEFMASVKEHLADSSRE